MNTKHLSTAALLFIAATFAGCAGDEKTSTGQQRQQPGTEGMTEFAVVDYDANVVATRTSGEYTGSSVKFYWTSNDQLWINNTASASPLKPSSRSTIPTPNGKEATAKFWFEDRYIAPTYPVRYTGNGNAAGDKVIIKSAQAQQAPNDGAHIGTDGDCGTATAHRQGDGSYLFTLDHKASYLTFMPCYSKVFDPSVKVTQIKVSADQPLAGTYDFDDTGIKPSTATATSQSVTLTLCGGGTNGFEIPVNTDYGKNAAIMVVAPGSYTNFTVEYTLHDQATNITGTVKKNYGNVICNVGKNKKFAMNFAIPHYDNKYYMWDAAQHYWQGYEQFQPKLNKQTNNIYYPQVPTDARWFTPRLTPDYAHNTNMINCPNANAIAWYVLHGEPHWDNKTLWSTMGHLYNKGIWMKKHDKITGFGWDTAPDGTDWRLGKNPILHGSLSNSPLNDSEKGEYFYLPCLGRYLEGELVVGNHGLYWSNTAGVQSSLAAGGYYYPSLYFYENFIVLHYDDAIRAQKVWQLDKVPTD